jgi:hypothetical protein
MNNNFKGTDQLPQWPVAQGLSVSDTRYRVDHPTWVISNGCDIGAGGMMGRLKMGKGEMVFIQFDPRHLPADTLTYLRFTRLETNKGFGTGSCKYGCLFCNGQSSFRNPRKTG